MKTSAFTLSKKTLFAIVKRTGVVGLLFAPLLAMSQTTVFNDTFGSGSTLNNTSPAWPTANSTAYQVLANKALSGNSIAANNLAFGDAGSSTAGTELQALFATTPVTLSQNGDYVQLTVTFTNVYAVSTANPCTLAFGLYNSGQQKPYPGGGNILATAGPYNGYAQGWVGYLANNKYSGGLSAFWLRPAQLGNLGSNQDLVISSASSSGFHNGTSFGSVASTVTLTASVYTNVFTIMMNSVSTNSLAITNTIYDSSGNLVGQFGSVATNANFATNSFDGLAIGSYGSHLAGAMMHISHINVTASVASAPTSPGPTFGVSGGGFGCPGGLVPVTLSGSVTTNNYLLYTNGVFSGVISNGTGNAITFNSTVQTGSITNTIVATNTALALSALMSGSAVVASYPAPSITAQPASITVATNSVGVFVVVASGNGLSYQWHRNGTNLLDGGHITGSTTATLIVSPATPADVLDVTQAYYCTVSNVCGAFVISTTNSLMLDAPANLVWQGGSPSNIWDVATSPNFTNSASTAVNFNNGDNVTLDDSSANLVIKTVGYVAPGTITNTSSQNYVIAASSSSLIGPGNLVMSGTGTLTISNANTFTGGTTISSGTVLIQNYAALGSGNVTLAGGTLVIPKGGSTGALGLSNNIAVNANSTLQYGYYTTSYSGVLWAALGGNAGTTLTINESDATANTARLRLNGSATNNADIILTTAGATNEIATYGGTQVYNGVISGNGHFITRGATVILNSTNTLNDGTYSVIMSGGTLGLGIDSTAIGSTIQSSPVGTNDLVITTADGNTLRAEGGARTLDNGIHYYSAVGTNAYAQFILGGSNKLTLAGNFQLSVSSPGIGTNCLVNVANTAATVISGQITDGGAGSGFIKSGNGALYLDNANNTYTGPTTNTAGLLAGSGSIAGPVMVNTNTSIGGGNDLSIGTLTINSNLSLSGNVFIRLNKNLSPSQSNDMVSVSGILANSGAGTVTVTNLVGAPALAAGDSFKLFSKAVSNGAALTVIGGGVNWTNKLAVDGSIAVLSLPNNVATNPTNITFSVANNVVTLTWPADHLGWYLQVQTNSLSSGLGTNWVFVPNSSNVTTTNFTVNPANGSVFYRLKNTNP